MSSLNNPSSGNIPDYTRGETFAKDTHYICPSDGFVSMGCSLYASTSAYLKINGTEVLYFNKAFAGTAGGRSVAPVKKGDDCWSGGNEVNYLAFYPARLA